MLNPTSGEENRAYRKNLSSSGLIYLGFEEHAIKISNLSLTGFLAELIDQHPEERLKDIFKNLQVSPLVDFYLPALRLAGEADVVRVDLENNGLLIGVEFRDLSYDVDSLLYNRRAYRKKMAVPGEIIISEIAFDFSSENVSVDGLMARIPGHIRVEPGIRIFFAFKQLELQGEAEVVWVEQNMQSTLLGIKYIHLERGDFSGAPTFTGIPDIGLL